MDQKTFAKLVSKAQEDPEFFHRLTFTPEKDIDELKDDVPRSVLGSLVGKEPAEMVARTLGVLGYCGNTCSSSCGNTCNASCGYTTNLVDEFDMRSQFRFNQVFR